MRFIHVQIRIARTLGEVGWIFVIFLSITWLLNRASIPWIIQWDKSIQEDFFVALAIIPLSAVVGAYWKSFLPEEEVTEQEN